MELNIFIKESLLQIFQGISEAQHQALEEFEGIINPVIILEDEWEKRSKIPAVASEIEQIHFDIAVEASEKKDNQGGIAVISGIFSVGGKSGKEVKDIYSSRIQFEVPVKFPGLLEEELVKVAKKNKIMKLVK